MSILERTPPPAFARLEYTGEPLDLDDLPPLSSWPCWGGAADPRLAWERDDWAPSPVMSMGERAQEASDLAADLAAAREAQRAHDAEAARVERAARMQTRTRSLLFGRGVTPQHLANVQGAQVAYAAAEALAKDARAAVWAWKGAEAIVQAAAAAEEAGAKAAEEEGTGQKRKRSEEEEEDDECAVGSKRARLGASREDEDAAAGARMGAIAALHAARQAGRAAEQAVVKEAESAKACTIPDDALCLRGYGRYNPTNVGPSIVCPFTEFPSLDFVWKMAAMPRAIPVALATYLILCLADAEPDWRERRVCSTWLAATNAPNAFVAATEVDRKTANGGGKADAPQMEAIWRAAAPHVANVARQMPRGACTLDVVAPLFRVLYKLYEAPGAGCLAFLVWIMDAFAPRVRSACMQAFLARGLPAHEINVSLVGGGVGVLPLVGPPGQVNPIVESAETGRLISALLAQRGGPVRKRAESSRPQVPACQPIAAPPASA